MRRRSRLSANSLDNQAWTRLSSFSPLSENTSQLGSLRSLS